MRKVTLMIVGLSAVLLMAVYLAYAYGLYVGYRDAFLAEVDREKLALNFQIDVLEALENGESDETQERLAEKIRFGMNSLRNAQENVAGLSFAITIREGFSPKYIELHGQNLTIQDLKNRFGRSKFGDRE